MIVTVPRTHGIACALRFPCPRREEILLTGSTGFLGKVTLSMLLHRYGEVLGRVWVLVRRGSATSAEARFVEKVVRSEPFQPLRDHRGDAEAEAFVRARCGVLDGDITDPLFGLSDEGLGLGVPAVIRSGWNGSLRTTFSTKRASALVANPRRTRTQTRPSPP